jgi:hypothetical protein
MMPKTPTPHGIPTLWPTVQAGGTLRADGRLGTHFCPGHVPKNGAVFPSSGKHQ